MTSNIKKGSTFINLKDFKDNYGTIKFQETDV